MSIIQIVATILVCLVVGVIAVGTTKQYYKNLIAASDADWRKKLRETVEDYEKKIRVSTGEIVGLNAVILNRDTVIKEHCATIERITETRDEYLELYHSSEVEISNLKDQLKEAEEANDILNKQLDEARECYEETRSELETNWGKKFEDIQEENTAMAKKIQDQAMEIVELKKKVSMATAVINGKLDPLIPKSHELIEAINSQMELYREMQNDEGLEHPYILDCADDKTLQEVTAFLRENADRAKVAMDGRISEQMVDAIAGENTGTFERIDQKEGLDVYIPSAPAEVARDIIDKAMRKAGKECKLGADI